MKVMMTMTTTTMIVWRRLSVCNPSGRRGYIIFSSQRRCGVPQSADLLMLGGRGCDAAAVVIGRSIGSQLRNVAGLSTQSGLSSKRTSSSGPIAIYNDSVSKNIIRYDAHQHKVMVQLEKLHAHILDYEANPYITRQEIVKIAQATSSNKGKSSGTFQKYMGIALEDSDSDGLRDDGSLRQVSSSGPPKGLYLWGGKCDLIL
jgi:hypothetical protein